MRVHFLVAIGLLIAAPTSLGAQQPTLTPQELHDRIVSLVRSRAPEGFPSGDTLVSWYKRPIIFHLVHHEANRYSEGMLRGDGLAGIVDVSFKDSRPTEATVSWTQPDSTPINLRFQVRGDSLLASGTTQGAWSLPDGLWAISDYGMEDLVLPALTALSASAPSQTIQVYRPFAGHWDTLTVTSRANVGDGILYDLKDSDGSRDWWLVGPTGSLLQIRRAGQDFERRPLEQTTLLNEYHRLTALLPAQ